MTDHNRPKPTQFAPKPEVLLARIRELAKSGCVWFSDHAEDRMVERGISDLDVYRVFMTGEIEGNIEPGKKEAEWKCKVVAPIKGRRDMGVVTLVIRNRRLKIKTVEWEDLR